MKTHSPSPKKTGTHAKHAKFNALPNTATKKVAANTNSLAPKLKHDPTFTKAQRTSQGFRPEVVKEVLARKKIQKGAFRYPSNPTASGFSSGYHEAFVVTDMTEVMSRRSKVIAGRSRMPVTSGYWHKHKSKTFPEANLSPMLYAGDAARTDTARTILSAPGGKVAGHSGSNVDTTNQDAAHNVLRDHAVGALQDPQMTDRAFGVLAAATSVYSMAPGSLARTATNAHKLKDKSARKTWEHDRNTAKEHLAFAFDNLQAGEKARVLHHMSALHTAIGGSGRKLEQGRPSSPRRVPTSSTSDPIQGGAYVKGNGNNASITGKPIPWLSSNPSGRDIAAGVTASFRIRRP